MGYLHINCKNENTEICVVGAFPKGRGPSQRSLPKGSFPKGPSPRGIPQGNFSKGHSPRELPQWNFPKGPSPRDLPKGAFPRELSDSLLKGSPILHKESFQRACQNASPILPIRLFHRAIMKLLIKCDKKRKTEIKSPHSLRGFYLRTDY